MAYIHALLISAMVIGFLIKGDLFTSIALLSLLTFESLWDQIAKRHSTVTRNLLFFTRLFSASLVIFFLSNQLASFRLLNLAISFWLLNALLAFVFLAIKQKN